MFENLEQRCNAIEECYEFMLAYAAQGLPGDRGSSSGGTLRDFLTKATDAIRDLADAYEAAVIEESLEPVERYRAFLDVLARDAKDSLAAIDLVTAQPSISSQLIDNLNASIHLRALLTDLFLIDEVVKLRRRTPDAVSSN